MIDALETRTLLSATLCSADPDAGGEAPVALHASMTTTTTADPDEGGEADPDEGGEVTTKATPTPMKVMKTYDAATSRLFL
jgi:hypothetical protein